MSCNIFLAATNLEQIVGVLLRHQSVSLLSFWFEVPEPAMGPPRGSLQGKASIRQMFS